MNSQSLFTQAQKVFPGGVNSPVRAFKGVDGTPIFFNKARGPYLYSVEGQRYIDFCQSFGPNILGHLDDDVLAEVRLAIEEAWTFGACEPYSLELAEWILSRLTFLDKIRFVCSGTEAVMSALRLARAYTGRSKILKFDGCYHGHVDSLLVKAGSGLATLGTSDSAGVSSEVASETIVVHLDDEKSVEAAFKNYSDQIAAVIIEPLPANFGLLLQRPEFIKSICDMAKRNGSLVIFDEVISGFRVALGGMAEVLGIKPDLVTYGKIIGGGFPVGAYAGRADILDLVAPAGPVYQAGTLAANPIGMRAGLATLKKLEKKNGYSVLAERTNKWVKELNQILAKKSHPATVTHMGSIFWLHSQTDRPVRSPRDFLPAFRGDYKSLFYKALEGGIYLAPSAFEVGFVSMAHDDDVLLQAQDIFSRMID